MFTLCLNFSPYDVPISNDKHERRKAEKVKCYAGNVEYKLYIDAVTGTVLSSKVDVDDDIF